MRHHGPTFPESDMGAPSNVNEDAARRGRFAEYRSRYRARAAFYALASRFPTFADHYRLDSLIDENRHWFKSKVGFATDDFSGHCVLVHRYSPPDVFVVPYALASDRFRTNPL